MDKVLIEDSALRDKWHVFEDRFDAGKRLAEKLIHYKGTDSVILAIPHGGVPIASEISMALAIPMDLIIVRKLQIPDRPEAGFGAVGPDGEAIFNEALLSRLGMTDDEIAAVVEKTRAVIKERRKVFRGERPFTVCTGRNIIIVDDGLASGYTMHAAVRTVRKMAPLRLIIAVPTGSECTVKTLFLEVDELVCLNIRSGFTYAVADAYRKWHDLSEEEVLSILEKQRAQEFRQAE